MRSALRHNLPASAGIFSCSRARCYTCSFLNSATSFSGPKLNYVIRHNFTCTSSNIISCISCISCIKCSELDIGETGRCLSDRFAEHLRSVWNNDVDKPVARHFNAANHSVSDIKVCAISLISGGNNSHKRHEKHLIFNIGTIYPHGHDERFPFIRSYPFIVSACFCLATPNKSVDFSPFHSIVHVHPPPTYSFRASASLTDRL